jgi:hypothetical protein
MGIYVETRIRGTVDDLWERTQRPNLHSRWDLRFSAIHYLPRPNPAQAQRFEYVTRIGFGLSVHGTGETVGERETHNGRRTSALTFWSDDPKSLIAAGSGYWQYLPVGNDVCFLTWYDYQTRFGLAGRILDRLMFRPLIGWATAWSFDRLRLWIERDIDPATALQSSVAHVLVRTGIAFLGSSIVRIRFQRRSPMLGRGVILAAMLISLLWPVPDDIPAARRCRRRPQPQTTRYTAQ